MHPNGGRAITTATLSYLRLPKSDDSPADLASWRERDRVWVGEGVDVYAYVKHEDNPDARRIALELASGLA